MSTTIQDLLETLADGVEGYSTAAKNVKSPELKALFEDLASERQRLQDELSGYGETPTDDEKPTVAGALHRGFINLKAAITAGDDHAILAECEHGEDHAVEVFKKAAADTSVPKAEAVVDSILARILAAHNKIKSLRDSTK